MKQESRCFQRWECQKYFAPEIGMAQDGLLKLVKYGKIVKIAK